MRTSLWWAVALLGALLASCGPPPEPVAVPLPATVHPAAADRVAWPQPAGVTGHLVASGRDDDGLAWAHLRGYIETPIETVAAAMQQSDVLVDRRKVDAWKAEELVGDANTRELVVHHTVHAIITVEYDVTWRLSPRLDGEAGHDLAAFGAIYQKTAGTSYIDVLAGSVSLAPAGEGVTAVEIVTTVKATRAGPEDMVSYAEDLFASIARAAVGP